MNISAKIVGLLAASALAFGASANAQDVKHYRFAHDQAACSDTVTVAAQNQANDFVKGLVPKLTAIK